MNWPHAAPPFHAGEQALQARVGLRERLHAAGHTIMRTAMPAQHRELFEKLPFVVLGLLDGSGRPWATLAAGAPGFARTPDAQTLAIGAAPLGAATAGLQWGRGDPVGLLGIEPTTRRRNRANGTVLRQDANSFDFGIAQSFGNCPQYIQARTFAVAAQSAAGLSKATGSVPPPEAMTSVLPSAARALVARADTFFIATASPDTGSSAPAQNGGLDASHRGGRPGFVRLAASAHGTRLVVPDYAGNKFFNTLGNIALRPQAGLCFVDWATGDLLLLTCAAHSVWHGPEIADHAGAERLLVADVEAGWWLPGVLPWRSVGPVNFAPQLARLSA